MECGLVSGVQVYTIVPGVQVYTIVSGVQVYRYTIVPGVQVHYSTWCTGVEKVFFIKEKQNLRLNSRSEEY